MKTNKIYLGDCLEVMKDIPDDSINLIITDPPYEEKYNYIWEPLGFEASRILKVGGNLISLCGHHQMPIAINDLSKNLRWWWPLWMRQDKIKTMCGKWVSIKGKPGVWFLKEKRNKIDGFHIPWDSISGLDDSWKESQKLHKWGQPIGWFAHYIEKLTLENDIVLDPFVGSGSSLYAAKKLNRRYIGIEKDEKYYKVACERIK